MEIVFGEGNVVMGGDGRRCEIVDYGRVGSTHLTI